MKRTTISLPDQLQEELEQYQQDQTVRPPTSALIQTAIREYLERRGYGRPQQRGGFHITPAPEGSGTSDGSSEHDRYVAEVAEWR
jgi:Arc/MetJ-type ribon-helix-helix transcriptional regulator